MRALSAVQAGRCEFAHSGKCRCRCGGRFHGAARALQPVTDMDAVRNLFEALPAEDPHHIPDAEEKKQQRKDRKRNARRQRELPLFSETMDA